MLKVTKSSTKVIFIIQFLLLTLSCVPNIWHILQKCQEKGGMGYRPSSLLSPSILPMACSQASLLISKKLQRANWSGRRHVTLSSVRMIAAASFIPLQNDSVRSTERGSHGAICSIRFFCATVVLSSEQ